MKSFELQTEEDFDKETQEIINYYSKDKLADLQKLLDKIKLQRKKAMRESERNEIVKALNRKEIYYKKNGFYGKFSLKLGRELMKIGAVWHSATKSYKIEYGKLPQNIQQAITFIANQNEELKSEFEKIIDVSEGEKKSESDKKILTTMAIIGGVLYATNKIINKNLTNNKSESGGDGERESERVSESESEFDATHKEEIKKSCESLDYKIKSSTQDNTKAMREKFFEALRLNKSESELENIVRDHIHGTQKRVEFIVKQETRLLLNEYQKEKLLKNGKTKFMWVHRVPYHPHDRDQHIKWFEQSNNGKVFDFNNLPINPQTGQEDFPGKLYWCHCKAKVVM